MCNSVTETDITLVEFSSLLSDVQLNRFTYVLPPSVTKVVSSETTAVKDDGEKAKKKVKVATMVRNNDPVEEWKLRGSESWATVFRNKTTGGPMLTKNCKPCLKYQVKGVCYTDCMQKASHCVLVDNDKKATDDYIKQLRGE